MRKTPTLSDVRAHNLAEGFKFFDRGTMKFFGDTMRSFRVVYAFGSVYVRRVSGRASVGKVWRYNPATGNVSSVAEIKRPDVAELSAFSSGYVACALWSSEFDAVNVADLPDETLNVMLDDAEEFARNNRGLLDMANEQGRDDEHLGHDFWLTRCHHGAGFWDRGLGNIGDALTRSAHAAGERSLYLGDDGKVYHG